MPCPFRAFLKFPSKPPVAGALNEGRYFLNSGSMTIRCYRYLIHSLRNSFLTCQYFFSRKVLPMFDDYQNSCHKIEIHRFNARFVLFVCPVSDFDSPSSPHQDQILSIFYPQFKDDIVGIRIFPPSVLFSLSPQVVPKISCSIQYIFLLFKLFKIS